ncbi:MAG: FG-GAP-like repeat-containing protein [Pyrinomonadaceae bacterium]
MKQKNGNRNFLRFGALLVLMALWVIIPFAIGNRTASAEEMLLSDVIRLGATLTGAPISGVTPTGFAEYKVDDQNRRRLDVDGSSINLPSGTILTLSINNAVIGQASVSPCSTFSFRRQTDAGEDVPVITGGMPVQVLNGNTVVIAGTFGSASPSPSASPNASPSPSPNASPCANPSPSPTGSPNGSPSPSPTGSPNGTPNPSPSPTGSPNGGDLFAGLSGATINGILPNGFAQFEIHSSRLELEVRVNQVNLPGTQLAVIVDGVNVGSLFISGGAGSLRLRTDNGQTVPPVIVGSTIVLKNGGTNILSGTFMGFTGPSPTASPSPGGSPSPSPSPSLGRSFESHLTGTGTAATGEVKVTLNATETQATIFGEFHNLSSNQTGARIDALVGDGVLVHDLGVVGGINGNFASRTIDVNAGQVSQLRAGLWSAVITSVNNPGGEIRGQFKQRSNLADFDGDGSNDLSVFRPSDGVWYSLNGSGFTSSQFGSASDKVVSADYDGDGRTDTAVFRNVAGLAVWDVKRSSDGGVSSEQFGFATDLPARGDFDGDGINDIAVFRPSTGVWYIKNSSNPSFTITRFGLSEDKPIALDVDGDGRDDIAVFRPSDGNWYWLRSSDGQFTAVHFGLSGDVPVRGDFDGDGKSDLTVYRPSIGVWYSLYSSDGSFHATRFGLDGDVPVAGSYDGDSKTDIAVFRPSDGRWYILRSVDGGFQAMQFGLNGDVPTIAR